MGLRIGLQLNQLQAAPYRHPTLRCIRVFDLSPRAAFAAYRKNNAKWSDWEKSGRKAAM